MTAFAQNHSEQRKQGYEADRAQRSSKRACTD